MKIHFLTIYLLLTLSISVFAATPGEVKIGESLRDVSLHGFKGQVNKFSDYKGKPLIINVWASWCGPCRAEMSSLERLASRYNGKELNVIGVSIDDNKDAAAELIEQTGITFDNFLDRKLLLENMLGAKTIPLTILIDADGQVLKKIRGARDWDNPKVIDYIGEVLRINSIHDPMFGLHIR